MTPLRSPGGLLPEVQVDFSPQFWCTPLRSQGRYISGVQVNSSREFRKTPHRRRSDLLAGVLVDTGSEPTMTPLRNPGKSRWTLLRSPRRTSLWSSVGLLYGVQVDFSLQYRWNALSNPGELFSRVQVDSSPNSGRTPL